MPTGGLKAADVERAVTSALQRDAAARADRRKKMIIAGLVGDLVIGLALAACIWWVTNSMIANFEALY